MIFSVIIFSGTMPLMIFVGALAFLALYWTDKLLLLRMCQVETASLKHCNSTSSRAPFY